MLERWKFLWRIQFHIREAIAFEISKSPGIQYFTVCHILGYSCYVIWLKKIFLRFYGHVQFGLRNVAIFHHFINDRAGFENPLNYVFGEISGTLDIWLWKIDKWGHASDTLHIWVPRTIDINLWAKIYSLVKSSTIISKYNYKGVIAKNGTRTITSFCHTCTIWHVDVFNIKLKLISDRRCVGWAHK